MKPDSIRVQHSINKATLELAQLRGQEHAITNKYGDDAPLLTMVRNNIQTTMDHIKELEDKKENTTSQSDDNKVEIKELESKAYGGDEEAIQKLIALSQGKGQNAHALAAKARQILVDLAEQGHGSICSILAKECSNDPAILAGLVKGDSAYAQDAAEKLAENINVSSNNAPGKTDNSVQVLTPDMLERILHLLCKDAERNIHLIAKFANTQQGAVVLADIAINKPTTPAGKTAARILGKAFASGDTKVASIALKGLIAAGVAGNGEAVNALVSVVKSNVSQKKAMQAIDALEQIAGSSGQAGSENTGTALGGLINIVNDPKVSSKLRVYAIDKLGGLIKQGADPQMAATDSLINLARNSNNPMVAESARENIFSAAESNPLVLDRAVGLFHDVAKGNKNPNNKVRMQAVALLGKAVQNGGQNSNQAIQHLFSLTKNPNPQVAKGSLNELKNLGLAVNKKEVAFIPANAEVSDKKEASKMKTEPFVLFG